MLSGAAVGGPFALDAGGPRSGKGPVSEEFGHGIHVVDSGFVRPRLDAIHLIVERGHVAIVDTGTNDAVPRVLQTIADLGLTPEPGTDHAAYIQSWLKVLKEDNRAIFSAAAYAQKAADYLHGFQAAAATKEGVAA